MDKKDINLLCTILKTPEVDLFSVLKNYLASTYNAVYSEDEYYLYAVGEIPIMLVAHLDTVWSFKPTLIHNTKAEIIYGKEGCGGDDRCGVFAILKILQAGLRPSILFTRSEELGGIGAEAFLLSFQKPLSKIKYILELDRQGTDEMAIYECGNKKLFDYLSTFGYKQVKGLFTDICFFAADWDIGAVNLSIGFNKEHTYNEYIHLPSLENTIKQVKKMLKDIDNQPFYKFEGDDHVMKRIACDKCGRKHNFINIIPIGKNNYCLECIDKIFSFCAACGQPFYINGKQFCEKCEKEVKNEKSTRVQE